MPVLATLEVVEYRLSLEPVDITLPGLCRVIFGLEVTLTALHQSPNIGRRSECREGGGGALILHSLPALQSIQVAGVAGLDRSNIITVNMSSL